MIKPIKFDLKLSNGTKLATLDDLEENLSPALFEHFHSGKLAKWLRVRKLEELAEKVEALQTEYLEYKNELDVQLFKKLCEVFVSEVDLEDAREAMQNYKPTVLQESNDDEIEKLKAENDELRKEIEQFKQEATVKTEASKGHKIGKFIVKDGIATDTETGLTWLRFAYGQKWENGTATGEAEKRRWSNAMKIPEEFNQTGYAGYNDWRVPTIDELETLIDEKEQGRYGYTSEYRMDVDIFPKNQSKTPWLPSSFASYAGSSGKCISVSFHYGSASDDYYVRLVRGGQ